MLIYLGVSAQLNTAFCMRAPREEAVDNAQLYSGCIYFTIR